MLCSAFARFVVKHDPQAQFRLATAQSVLGQGLFRHYGLDPQDFETNLLIDNGHAFGKLDAFVRIMTRLGGVNRLAVVTTVLPSGVGDFLYDRIAGNRYRLFGRSETCMLPPADWRERFLG